MLFCFLEWISDYKLEPSLENLSLVLIKFWSKSTGNYDLYCM